ncbi:hypothetical protein LSCM1_06404 [Leishmania martiniquensis]|uniref:Uncharacterized protein n=1 Tax=Leishmania martiniquensis TaxID=1580590 RepID=A0A836H9D3_9TRYP|nr:hypothetical protein LSCM1_06404 [Leishmania martiniquensis]
MNEASVATSAAASTAALQHPSGERSATASLASGPAVHRDPQVPQPSSASRTSTGSASVAEAKPVTATVSTAADPSEPVLVGKVVLEESSQVQAPCCASDGDSSQSAEQYRRSLPETSLSSSYSYSSTDSVCEADVVDETELIFDFGRYVGQVDPLTGLRHGHGCLHYKSGNIYTGQWRDGAADGFGEKRYKNGDVYRGNWRRGKRSGRGAYLFNEGHFYDGMYVEDEPEGYGIYTTLKGDRYAGRWKAGHKHGKGRETLVNGQVFVGNWRHGKKQGRGKLYLPGAQKYIYGVWNNDAFFRELTASEMGADGEADIVDEFGIPRDPSSARVTPPTAMSPAFAAGITDRMLMGVTALEDRMESLGRALEHVISSIGGDGSAQAPAAEAAGAHSPATGAGALAEDPVGQPVQGFVVNSLHEEDDDVEGA